MKKVRIIIKGMPVRLFEQYGGLKDLNIESIEECCLENDIFVHCAPSESEILRLTKWCEDLGHECIDIPWE